MNDLKKDEVLISYLLAVLWKNKLFVFLAVLLSIFFSYFSISIQTPIFTAEVVLDPEEQESQVPVGLTSAPSLINLVYGQKNPPETYKIINSVFLEALINYDEKISSYLDQFCEYSNPNLLSVAGLVDLFSVHNLKNLNADQEKEFRIQCLRDNIAMENYFYKGSRTQALLIKATNSDPFFAAYLAGAISEFFIKYEQDEVRETYLKSITFLTEALLESKMEADKSSRELEEFYLINPAFTSNTKLGDLKEVDIANEKVRDLGNLEEKTKLIEECQLSLASSISDANNYNLSTFFEAKCQPILSNQLWNNVLRFDNEKISDLENFSDIEREVNQEIFRLTNIKDLLQAEIKNEELKAARYIKLKERLEALRKESQVKLDMYVAMQKMYLEKKLEEKSLNLNATKIVSEAVAPITPSSPNTQKTLVANAVIFSFLSIIGILFRQYKSPHLYHSKQLLEDFSPKNLSMIRKSRDLNLKRLAKGSMLGDHGIEVEQILEILKKERVISVIDLSSRASNRVSDCVSIFLARLLSISNSNTVCYLKNRKYFGNEASMSNKSFLYDATENRDSNKIVVPKQVGIAINQSENYKNELKGLIENKRGSQLLISLRANSDNQELESAIESSDRFILVAELAFTKLKSFNNLKIKKEFEKKCIGVLLVS